MNRAYIFEEFKEYKDLKAGDKIDIQIMRSGKRKHPQYGEVKIDENVIDDVINNFTNQKRKIDLAVDENHEGNHRALGRFKKIYKQGVDALFATIELTKLGADLVSQGAYKYFSPEIILGETKDDETGEKLRNLLVGGAFTNRPFFKNMQGLMANDEVSRKQNDYILFNKLNEKMEKFLEILGQFAKKDKLTEEEKKELTEKFNELEEEDKKAVEGGLKEVIGEEEEKKEEEKEEDKEDKEEEEENDKEEEEKEEEKDEEKEEEKDEEKDTLKANENVTIKATEYNDLKKLASEVSKLQREARKSNLNEKFKTLSFSETNKKGVILNKNINDFVEFALSLSEPLSEKFIGLLENIKKVDFKEYGSGKESKKLTGDELDLDMIEKAKIIASEKNITIAQALGEI